jgi:hypothetical protein
MNERELVAFVALYGIEVRRKREGVRYDADYILVKRLKRYRGHKKDWWPKEPYMPGEKDREWRCRYIHDGTKWSLESLKHVCETILESGWQSINHADIQFDLVEPTHED